MVGKRSNERRAELENHFTMALERLLALLERGMTVELRLGPPPESDDVGASEGEVEQAKIKAYRAVEQIQQQLVFPKPQGAPLMELSDRSGEASD